MLHCCRRLCQVPAGYATHNKPDSARPVQRMSWLLLAGPWHSPVTECAGGQVLVCIPYTCSGRQEVPVDMNELAFQ